MLLEAGADFNAIDCYAVYWDCMDAYCALHAVGAPTSKDPTSWWCHKWAAMDADRRWTTRLARIFLVCQGLHFANTF